MQITKIEVKSLYISTNIAERIKNIAKNKKIVLKDMLEDCELGVNAIGNMTSGRMPAVDSVAKIADYLDVSVDYLLGRTKKDETAELINAYEKASPEIRSAVNVLLGLSEEAPKHADYRLAAYGGKGVIKDVPTKPKIT